MGVQARLTPSTVEIAVSQPATVQVAVRNTGTAADRFTIEVARGAAPWIRVPQPSLELLPYEEGSVPLVFTPPRSPDVVAGAHAFALRVTSGLDAMDQVTVAGSATVGAYSDVTTELVPRTVTGRRLGRAQLTVVNRSNVVYRAEPSGTDPDLALGLAFTPPILEVAPGQTMTAAVAIRPRVRLWRGVEVTRPFTIVLTEAAGPGRDFFGDAPAGQAAADPPAVDFFGDPVTPAPAGPGPTSVAPATAAAAGVHPRELTVTGAMVQAPLTPDRALPVGIAVLIVVVLAVVGWYGIVRPQIRSTVRSEVEHQLAASGVTAGPTGRSGTAGARSGAIVGGPADVAGGLTVNGSLLAAGNGTQSYDVPAGKDLEITDLLVQNAAGDSGVVALAQGDKILMQWSMANFRDLDYHWITPISIGPGVALQLQTSGCTNTCTPSLYYAGALVPAQS